MRDPRCELAERGQLLGLDQPVLRGTQFLQRVRELARTLLDFVEQAGVFDCDRRLVGKGHCSSICLSVNGRTSDRVRTNTPIVLSSCSIGTLSMVRNPPSRCASTKV